MISNEKLESVIICHFPNVQEMTHLIDALNMSTGLVMLINNGGLDEHVEKLQRSYGKILIIHPDENIGIASALNKAFFIARDSGFSHLISFDQDSNLTNGMLEILIDEFNKISKSGKKIGAIGPRFYDPRKPLFEVDVTCETNIVKKSYIITSGCLASVDAWSASGGFNELLFIDLVDVEWCWRLNLQGYEVYMSADANMAHQLSDGMKVVFKNFVLNTYSPLRRYYLARNSIYLILSKKWNWMQRKYLLKSFLFSFFSAMFSDRKKIASIRFIVIGIIDAISGRMGVYIGKLK
jgi:rhamnosyltransferase